MTTLVLGDVLVSFEENPGQLSHYNTAGAFIENIALPNANAHAVDIRQYNGLLYIMWQDDTATPVGWALEEYDAHFNKLRTIVNMIDASSPEQNPFAMQPGFLVPFRFDLDCEGKIYIGGINDYYLQYYNNGTFIRNFQPDFPTSTSENSVLMNPQNDCELVIVNNVGTPRVARYNICTDPTTLTANMVVGSGGSSFATDFHCNGKMVKVNGTSSIRVYDNGWGGFTDYAVPVPVGFPRIMFARWTDDEDYLWVWSIDTAISNPDWVMFLWRRSTNTIITGPLAFTVDWLVTAGDVWKTKCACDVPEVTTTASFYLAKTVHDDAVFSGGNAPTGLLTFNLYGPNNPTCAGAPAYTEAVTVSGNGPYSTANFTPLVSGTYHWVASYGGDALNAATATACDDPNEEVIVSKSVPVSTVVGAN